MNFSLRAGAPPLADHWSRRLAGGFFLLLALVYYLPSLGWLPRGIHEWAQADRLALALRFYDTGLHLFEPQTLNLSSERGIVGVEFPLLAYLAALGGKVAGRGAIVPIFRLFTISTAWLACYHLFKLVHDRTRQVVAALLPGIFLMASPAFAYYAGNFIPDPASLSLVLVAAYYLLGYPGNRRFGWLAGALALLTLATLLKLTSGIYLLAALGSVLLWAYLQPAAFSLRQRGLLLLLAGLSLALIAAYTLYNQYLNETYHSYIFLASPRPITSWAQLDQVYWRVHDTWLDEYFVKSQYVVLALSTLVVLLSLPRLLRTEWLWLAQLGLALLGTAAFLRLMGTQFVDHDYYALASFWPLLVLLVALAVTVVAQRLARARRWVAPGVFLILVLIVLPSGLKHYRARMGEPYKYFSDYYSYRWMQGGAARLAEAHLPASTTLLVLGEDAPNLSLVYFDRCGITWNPDSTHLPTAGEIRQKMSEARLDYLLLEQKKARALTRQHPDLLQSFQPVIRTPRFVLLKPTSPTQP
jgi:hypothetical protein